VYSLLTLNIASAHVWSVAASFSAVVTTFSCNSVLGAVSLR